MFNDGLYSGLLGPVDAKVRVGRSEEGAFTAYSTEDQAATLVIATPVLDAQSISLATDALTLTITGQGFNPAPPTSGQDLNIIEFTNFNGGQLGGTVTVDYPGLAYVVMDRLGPCNFRLSGDNSVFAKITVYMIDDAGDPTS